MYADLVTHCSRLVGILGQTRLVNDWENVAEWLNLAVALKKFEIHIIDDSFGFCSYADEYTMVREKLLNEFVYEMSRFNFVWGGLESCLNIIKPPNHPDKSKRGKISNACYFLKQYYSTVPPISFLSVGIVSFRRASSECIGYESVEKRFKRANEIGWPGIGLFTVYELRNLFAHGSLTFPEPDMDRQPKNEYQIMVVHATRVVLLSIQMLLLAYFKHSDLEIPFSFNCDFNTDDLALCDALSGCHLETNGMGFQMSLF